MTTLEIPDCDRGLLRELLIAGYETLCYRSFDHRIRRAENLVDDLRQATSAAQGGR